MIRIACFALFVALTSARSSNLIRSLPALHDNPLSPQGRIVGGRETTIEELPWQVSLQVLGFHFCGGSILSKDLVLTAGHCTSYQTSWISVRVGSSVRHEGGTIYRVTEVIRHELFETLENGIPINDVAILKLRDPIELGVSAQPIKLFDVDEEAIEGSLSTISGWGSLTEGGSSPDVLHTVDVPIITKIECSKAYESYGGLPEKQICAAYPAGGKDTCQGDSGGPLVISGRQAGIVSWGNGCARKGYPGVYTEIATFRDWIAQHTGL